MLNASCTIFLNQVLLTFGSRAHPTVGGFAQPLMPELDTASSALILTLPVSLTKATTFSAALGKHSVKFTHKRLFGGLGEHLLLVRCCDYKIKEVMIFFLREFRACRKNTSTTPQECVSGTVLGECTGYYGSTKEGAFASNRGICEGEERLECDYFCIVFNYK